MCQFCAEHGDGKKWYLEAANYACDLESDLARRGYIIDFARDFDNTSASAVRYLTALRYAPSPLRRYVHGRITDHLKRNHFGQVVPREDAGRIFDITSSIVRVPCVCRRFAGKGEHSYCLLMTTRPIADLQDDSFVQDLAKEILGDYDGGPDLSAFELLSKPQAEAMLDSCESEGLMHSIWTFQTPFIAAMCNCDLDSGCMAMRLTRQFDVKVMWRGEYVAGVDADMCTGCFNCLDVCPFDAMERDGSTGRAAVRRADCFGCGVCRAACGEDAIELSERREVAEIAGLW